MAESPAMESLRAKEEAAQEVPIEQEDSSARMRLHVSRMCGAGQMLEVGRDCNLHDFKSLLVEKGLAQEGLAVDFIIDGTLVSPEGYMTKLAELSAVDDSHITVITRRSHDYGQIHDVQRRVKSQRWPQGVVTTLEGQLYVCHYEGWLQVYDLDLQLQKEAHLGELVRHPSQMAMSPDGELVMACAGGNVVAVDPVTFEHKWTYRGSAKSTGVAIWGGEIFRSQIDSGTVQVLDRATGAELRTLEGFQRPSGLCAFDGGLLVADRGADVVWLVDTEGSRKAIGKGELSHPNDVAVDLAGNLLVMDTGNERIAVFRPDGSAMCGILAGTFKDFGNTHSYISVNPINGTISVSMDDAHYVAILAPPIHSA
ncbi:trim71 [Symbiodinium natans]|uniref:Trim71 protein n=1 Tax=Symbiodinium natans TaxID=878477 RepID=A0A812RIY3_9DINO|nr:trim71 [Symbiodinium natans]